MRDVTQGETKEDLKEEDGNERCDPGRVRLQVSQHIFLFEVFLSFLGKKERGRERGKGGEKEGEGGEDTVV